MNDERKATIEVDMTDDEWIDRLRVTRDSGTAPRVRLVGPAPSRDGETAASVTALHRALAEATGGDPDIAVYDGQVTTAGRIELLPFLHEQSITITAHRFGNPDRWSEQVI